MTYDKLLTPDAKLGEISLSSQTYSFERLSSLVNSSFIKKGIYDPVAEPQLSIDQVAPLSVLMFSKNQFNAEENTLNDDAIYFVQTDNLDAFDKKVTNVSTPTDKADVANKQYVDDAFDERYSNVMNDAKVNVYSGIVLEDRAKRSNKYMLAIKNGKISLKKIEG